MAIAVGLSTVVMPLPEHQIIANAKTIKIDKKFAKHLKKGKLPDSKGAVGITYKKLKSLEVKRGYHLVDGNVYQRFDPEENPVYYFEYIKTYTPKSKDTVSKINKVYPSVSFKKSDVIKSMGKATSIKGYGKNFEAKYKYKKYTVTITSTSFYDYGYLMENSVIEINQNVSFKDTIDLLF